MKIKTFEGGYDKNLCYLIWCPKTKIAGIIDPSVEINPIIEEIEKNDLILSKILITHTHYDHILYLDSIKHLFPNAELLCYEKHIKKFKYHVTKLSDYEIITLGQEILISIYTPGHFIDSMCFWDKKNNLLFTGDTIFVGRTGRTISAHSNLKNLYSSVYDKIFKLPLNTLIFPGHNYGFTKSITIKENIRYSDFFSCKSFKEFELIMKKFESNYK